MGDTRTDKAKVTRAQAELDSIKEQHEILKETMRVLADVRHTSYQELLKLGFSEDQSFEFAKHDTALLFGPKINEVLAD